MYRIRIAWYSNKSNANFKKCLCHGHTHHCNVQRPLSFDKYCQITTFIMIHILCDFLSRKSPFVLWFHCSSLQYVLKLSFQRNCHSLNSYFQRLLNRPKKDLVLFHDQDKTWYTSLAFSAPPLLLSCKDSWSPGLNAN